MQIKGIIRVGSATRNREETTDFFAGHLGLEVAANVGGFTQLLMENGDRLELFGPDSVEHEQLDTGPVAGFWVDDIEEAHREPVSVGIAGVTDLERGRDGHRWFYFRAPAGNFYELCEQPALRPARGRPKA